MLQNMSNAHVDDDKKYFWWNQREKY